MCLVMTCLNADADDALSALLQNLIESQTLSTARPDPFFGYFILISCKTVKV